MRDLKVVITELEERKAELSPIQVGNFLVELVPHHLTLMRELDVAFNKQAFQIAEYIKEGKSMAVSKAIVEGSEIGEAVRKAKTNLAFIEELVSNLKYLARGIEKEYSYAKQ